MVKHPPLFSTTNIALLVIDMQADFYANFGSAAKRGKPVKKMQQIAGDIDAFINAYKGIFDQIIFTKYVSAPGITPPNLSRVAEKEGYNLMCEVGTGLEELYGVTAPKSAVVIEKPLFDAFAYTNLLELLRLKKTQTVVITGVRTEICVDATAKRAFSEGFDTIILSDLVGTYDDKEEIHKSVLDLFDKYSGFVMTKEQFVDTVNLK